MKRQVISGISPRFPSVLALDPLRRLKHAWLDKYLDKDLERRRTSSGIVLRSRDYYVVKPGYWEAIQFLFYDRDTEDELTTEQRGSSVRLRDPMTDVSWELAYRGHLWTSDPVLNPYDCVFPTGKATLLAVHLYKRSPLGVQRKVERLSRSVSTGRYEYEVSEFRALMGEYSPSYGRGEPRTLNSERIFAANNAEGHTHDIGQAVELFKDVGITPDHWGDILRGLTRTYMNGRFRRDAAEHIVQLTFDIRTGELRLGNLFLGRGDVLHSELGMNDDSRLFEIRANVAHNRTTTVNLERD